MRSRFLALTVALTLPLAFPLVAEAQANRPARELERFEVGGLPKAPASELEKEIFLLLRVHKKGDYSDASRIHLKLAQYYKEHGEELMEDLCNQKAMEAWAAASGERPASAGSPGSPPFEPQNTFARRFSHSDEMKILHTWEFFSDGTYSHVLATADQPGGFGPRERGWYTLTGDQMRLWQFKPRGDRTVRVELLGAEGRDGAILDGARMVVVP
ncbi:MAG: hypothetical protein ABS52_16790 [Gemmatimonadetes bacterium SCN 70-22]|nr:MAG: hypothetical protein ABS52_16790 [Gemmatimonadetes bacterium SCN 70-22]